MNSNQNDKAIIFKINSNNFFKDELTNINNIY